MVDLCIEALGPYYAGTKASGASTVVLGYFGRQPEPALRVTCKPARADDTDDSTPLRVKLQVLLPEIVDVALLDHRLDELAERTPSEVFR